jgi:hypothetical protein
MLKQELRQLEADKERQKIEIQKQVVEYYINSYQMIASQAALLAGFAWNGYAFGQKRGPGGEPPVIAFFVWIQARKLISSERATTHSTYDRCSQ